MKSVLDPLHNWFMTFSPFQVQENFRASTMNDERTKWSCTQGVLHVPLLLVMILELLLLSLQPTAMRMDDTMLVKRDLNIIFCGIWIHFKG